MTIVNVGMSCRTAPAGVLEKLAVPPGEASGVLARLHAMSAVDEVLVLSTRNRVEVYAVTQLPPEETARALAGALADRGQLPVSDLIRLARIHFGAAAAEHLCSVTCGLDSLVVGEEQIVAQVKAAARNAAAAGTAGPVLIALLDVALRASKRPRRQTSSGAGLGLVLHRRREPLEGLTGLALSPDERSTHVAVLGTGIMGAAMARNLLGAGLPTTVRDRSAAAAAPLAEAGAVVAASAEDALRDAWVVITMPPTPDAVNSVIFHADVAGRSAMAVWAQMGTIGENATAEAASRLNKLRPDVMFVDAPVSGSNGPAETGQLLVLASGPHAAEAITRPAFSAIGRKILWLGDAAQGSRMKLAVNAYMFILIEGVAETLSLASKLKVDAAKPAEAIEGGPLDAPIADCQAAEDGARRLRARGPAGVGAQRCGPGSSRRARRQAAVAGRPVATVALRRRRGCGRQDVSAAFVAVQRTSQETCDAGSQAQGRL